ncbi:DUF4249 domain-containing protein [Pedobacter faecalis]|uniref:DUF4249 domain-containing protein n=1 Tax=Pedobacter faecalis TaxID=3041495 RepID=UPI00255054D9|nr:DUF4249 domain-containing protein [Pedobacter sp. ELA7]
MGRIRIFIGLLLVAIAAAACEKVVDLDLDNAEPKIVIDASLNDNYQHHFVRVSRTYSFTEPNSFNGVAGAKVVLSIPGQDVNLREVEKGVYRTPRMRGMPGTGYTLNVTVDGVTYSSTSYMPEKVYLDSLSFKRLSFFGEENTYVAANFNDPANAQNNYRYLLTVKDKVEEDDVSDDRFNNGNVISNVLYHELDKLKTGDTLEVELQSINRDVYKYFFSLEQITGGGGPPVSPANPPSNFNNGALGVFNAHTSSRRNAVIQ